MCIQHAYTIGYDFNGVQISGMSSLSWARPTFFDPTSRSVLWSGYHLYVSP